MRKLWFAALAATMIAGAAPAFAGHDYHGDDRYLSPREAAWEAAERTRSRQERNSQRVMAETRRRQAANSARLRREALARQRGYDTYDHAYYDDAAYGRGRRDAEREFRRFADRNRDGRVSRREHEWAIARW